MSLNAAFDLAAPAGNANGASTSVAVAQSDPWAFQTSSTTTPESSTAQEQHVIKQKKQERQAKKKAKQNSAEQAQKQAPPPQPMRFTPREWLSLPGKQQRDGSKRLTLMTWNMLAQALVRRDLFPGSDFLKIKPRVPTLMAEVLHYSPSIVCLQEVDHVDTHIAALSSASYSSSYHIGYPDKSHGLLIAYQSSLLTRIDQREVRLDELSFSSCAPNDSTSVRAGRALSRVTRNVALLVALKHVDRPGGLIVGTTHLFWHPKHVYERVRQTALLFREADTFRNEVEMEHEGVWETFLAGDFNTQPNEITYALLKKLPLTSHQSDELTASSVIHQSVDKLYDPDYVTPEVPTPGEGEAEQDPDKIIKNSRPSTSADGLLSLDDFKRVFDSFPLIRSGYAEIHGLFSQEQGQWYVERPPAVQSGQGWKIPEDPAAVVERRKGAWGERIQRGDFEPMWSNFTPLWRCTLDYVFHLERKGGEGKGVEWTGLLKMHTTETMGEGLPRLGIEPSDHVAIACEFELP